MTWLAFANRTVVVIQQGPHHPEEEAPEAGAAEAKDAEEASEVSNAEATAEETHDAGDAEPISNNVNKGQALVHIWITTRMASSAQYMSLAFAGKLESVLNIVIEPPRDCFVISPGPL